MPRRKRDVNVVIGSRIRKVRKALSLSTKKFCELIGAAPSELNDVENGWRGMASGKLDAIAAVAVAHKIQFSLDDIVLIRCDKCSRAKYYERAVVEHPLFKPTCGFCWAQAKSHERNDRSAMRDTEVEVVSGCRIYPADVRRLPKCRECCDVSHSRYDACLTHAALHNWPGWAVKEG